MCAHSSKLTACKEQHIVRAPLTETPSTEPSLVAQPRAARAASFRSSPPPLPRAGGTPPAPASPRAARSLPRPRPTQRRRRLQREAAEGRAAPPPGGGHPREALRPLRLARPTVLLRAAARDTQHARLPTSRGVRRRCFTLAARAAARAASSACARRSIGTSSIELPTARQSRPPTTPYASSAAALPSHHVSGMLGAGSPVARPPGSNSSRTPSTCSQRPTRAPTTLSAGSRAQSARRGARLPPGCRAPTLLQPGQPPKPVSRKAVLARAGPPARRAAPPRPAKRSL